MTWGIRLWLELGDGVSWRDTSIDCSVTDSNMVWRVDQVHPGRHRRQPAGSVLHAGDNVQGSVGRQDAVRDRRFPGVRANERIDVRDTTVTQGTRPRLEGTAANMQQTNKLLINWEVVVALKRRKLRLFCRKSVLKVASISIDIH